MAEDAMIPDPAPSLADLERRAAEDLGRELGADRPEWCVHPQHPLPHRPKWPAMGKED